MLANKLMSALSGAEDKLYVDDVFSTYLRTGTGADTVVTTGIDMTEGYMLWSKSRSAATDWAVYDSTRGVTLDLVTNSTAAQTIQTTGLKAVSSTGHTVGSLAKMNTSGATYVDFVFKKKAKFFDVVTYTGNGVAGRQIPHALGIAPGMIVIKGLNNSQNWAVYHRSLGNSSYLYLSSTVAAFTGDTAIWGNTAPSATEFTIGNYAIENTSGEQYVAYLFAHDPSADGIVQCGSFTTDGSGNATVNLGWEPQYVMWKRSDGVMDWNLFDSTRGFPVGGGQRLLRPNIAASEVDLGTTDYLSPTATGFKTANNYSGAGIVSYIYLAIRRPNKPPTTGTQVYNAIARTGTGAAATVTGVGFAPDLTLSQQRSAVQGGAWYDRMRGATKVITPTSTGAEGTNAQGVTGFDVMDGFRLGTEGSVNATVSLIHHFFKRAPGFFDVVCYKPPIDEGLFNTTHSLGVPPELILSKSRASLEPWWVYTKGLSGGSLALNETRAYGSANMWGGMTATTFGHYMSTRDMVYYLFATKAGISKIGSYTGNGTTQTINCGFTTGARFILIKRTDSTGDWYVWDTARGIVSANDPHLSLNTTAAEVTIDDSVDPTNEGFIVNNVSPTNINVNAGQYIFLAIA